MRESWRGLMLLVRMAVRTDPWRSLGLLLEPISQMRYPLFAFCLKLMADGAVRQDLQMLMLGAGGIAATRALWFVGMWNGSLIRARLNEVVGFAFDREIATLTARLPGLEHHERADYLDRLELLRQQQGVLGNSLNSVINTANAVVGSVAVLVALAVTSPWLLLLVPFTLPALPIATLQQRWNKAAEEQYGPPARLSRHLNQLMVDRNAGMEMRVFGLEREVFSRFESAWHRSRSLALTVDRRMVVLNNVRDLVFLVGFAGAIALMLWRASHGQATVGDVVMAVYLGQQVKGGVVGPILSVAIMGSVLRAVSRMLWLQDYAKTVDEAGSGTRAAPERLVDGIVFEGVGFRYPGTERWVLRDVSLHIPAGAVIALVGENGSGKTTMVKLLSRMYEPTEGRILVDGVDLAQISVEGWRKRMSAAFQDFARFELSAQRSVGVGDLPRIDDEIAVQEALERAGASELLTELPSGPQTQLGSRWEGGVDLSTGQWQRLALGRALLRDDPLVLVLDEPTASLDALVEHALFERFTHAARAGSTHGAITVLVSHRFSTVRSADTILVVEDGRVSEMGDHEQLLEQQGLYAELYSLQARSYN